MALDISVSNQPIGGVAFVTIAGKTGAIAGEASYRVAAIQRESKAGLSGIAGYTSKIVPAFIEITGYLTGDLLISDYAQMTGVSVVFEHSDNTRVVSGSNLWTTDAVEVNAAEGTYRVRFEGGQLQEIIQS